MMGSGNCTEVINIFQWAVFGADGACINIGMQSVVGAVIAFLVAVTALQLIARRLWRHRRGIVQFIIAIPFMVAEGLRRSPSNNVGETPSRESDDQPVRSSRF